MPITSSAKKALRGSVKKQVYNESRKRAYREMIKKIERLVKDGKKDEALKLLGAAQSAIDKGTKSKVLKQNTASRKKARLARIVK